MDIAKKYGIEVNFIGDHNANSIEIMLNQDPNHDDTEDTFNSLIRSLDERIASRKDEKSKDSSDPRLMKYFESLPADDRKAISAKLFKFVANSLTKSRVAFGDIEIYDADLLLNVIHNIMLLKVNYCHMFDTLNADVTDT